MARRLKLLQVFVASPSDVTEERNIVDEVIRDINTLLVSTADVRLELLRWEEHTRPAVGDSAQAIVNEQIGDDYDIFIGIMWGRFGTPTDVADSGTEEEFRRAYDRFKNNESSVEILFYFKQAAIAPRDIDLEQLGKVKEFRDNLPADHGALYWEFESTDEFRTKVHLHLSQLAHKLSTENDSGEDDATTATPQPPAPSEADPLANLRALDDEDEEGLAELVEQAEDAMGNLGAIIGRISDAIHTVGMKFQQRTEEIGQIDVGAGPLGPKDVKRIANQAANDLEVLVNHLSTDIPEFQRQQTDAMDAFGKIATISASDLNEDPDDIKDALSQMQSYRAEIATSSGSLVEFQEITAGLPRMTTAFNRARRRAAAVLDDLIAQLRTAERQSSDVEQLLQNILESNDDTVG